MFFAGLANILTFYVCFTASALTLVLYDSVGVTCESFRIQKVVEVSAKSNI